MSRQLLQSVRDGDVSILDVPTPMVAPGHVLIANQASLISAGTEKAILELASKSLLGKARERPDHVRRVLQKIRNEGLWSTISQVREKLDEPLAMGYSSAGVVVACGDGVQRYQPGDRVASNGPHGEIVCIPNNLCASIRGDTPFDQAAFAVVGSIALHGVRLSRATLGESVLVIGLGLVGQIAVALLTAMGCRVIGTDLDAEKCQLALELGAHHASVGVSSTTVESLSEGRGADAVLITASTKSNAPIDLASSAIRKKGRIVLVGVVGLELDRRPFYFKEAEFLVSCSYGPGRYDPLYEEQGRDYPAAYVRWTEQRNIQAVLDLLGSGRLDFSRLITHRFDFTNALSAYQMIETNQEPYLGIVLEYPKYGPGEPNQHTVRLTQRSGHSSICVGVLGAGNFARLVLLPALADQPAVNLRTICSAGGVSAAVTGKRRSFELATTNEESVFADRDINTVFVLTRHDQHAAQVVRGLKAQKNVFVEKPLCLTLDELDEIEQTLSGLSEAPLLMVGLNRRFSPAARIVREFFRDVATPITVQIRFNAGEIPADHWTQMDEIGGGRIVGEACHGIDLATFLAQSLPVRVFATSVAGPAVPTITDDQSFINLRHENGSISVVVYVSSGDRAFPKERVEVIGGGRIAVIDDYKTVTTCRNGKTRRIRLRAANKGHAPEIRDFISAIRAGAASPISWPELRATSIASILAVRSLREGVPFNLE